MNKNIIFIIFINLVVIISLTGCNEKVEKKQNFDGISIESNVVELINASMNFKYNSTNEITGVEVIYLFHNIVDHIIEKLNITIHFFDKDFNLVAIGGSKYIRNLPIDYYEQTAMEPNKIYYEGVNSSIIDNCKIIAIEE